MRGNLKASPEVLIATGIFGITIITGAILSSSIVKADDVVDDVSVTVPMSCTMSGSGMASHTAEIANGIYQANIGTTTITALCNDNAGFSIYAAGYTGEEIGGTNSNKLVGTSASGNATIDTGTATGPGSQDVSNWAMKLTPVTTPTPTYPITIKGSSSDPDRQSGDTDYSTYSLVPNTYTKVATRLQGTDVGTNAEGSSLTTTYAAYISKTQPADTYSGKVKYTLVHPNNGPTPTPSPAPVSTCNTKVPGVTYMQDITASNKFAVLANMTTDAPYYLRDSRDGEPYCVSKLQDGNLWMIDNLRLDLTNSTIIANTTENNTNASATSLNYLKNGGGTTSDKFATDGLTGSNWTTTEGFFYSKPLVNVSGFVWNDESEPYTKDSVIFGWGAGSRKMGAFYNYCAVSAGSYCYGNGTSPGNPSGDATEDICPVNWHLPSSGGEGEYDVLVSTYEDDTDNYNTAFLNTFSVTHAGTFTKNGDDPGVFYWESQSWYWSSTHYTEYYPNINMFNLLVDHYDPWSGGYWDRSEGISARCVLNP